MPRDVLMLFQLQPVGQHQRKLRQMLTPVLLPFRSEEQATQNGNQKTVGFVKLSLSFLYFPVSMVVTDVFLSLLIAMMIYMSSVVRVGHPQSLKSIARS